MISYQLITQLTDQTKTSLDSGQLVEDAYMYICIISLYALYITIMLIEHFGQ